MNQQMTALILGATGVTGASLLELLLSNASYSQVITVTRKPIKVSHEKHINIVNALDRIEDIDLSKYSIHTIFSCLGTTRKKTPDLNQYRYIEIQIPILMAQKCISLGLQQIHFISAIGVNDRSRNFYISIKNQAENAIMNLPNHIRKFIYRPSLIIGKRSETRIMEQFSIFLFKILKPLFRLKFLRRYQAVHAENIAQTMLYHAIHFEQSGVVVVESEQIKSYGF